MAFYVSSKSVLIFRLFRYGSFPQGRVCIHSSSICPTQEKPTLCSQENGVRRITLNNPKKRNILSLSMLDSLKEDLSNLDKNNLSCILISGNGPVFSSGHDLQELTTKTGEDYHKKIFSRCTEVMMAIHNCPVPVIAQVRGLAAAAGCQLIASCDIVVASEKSKFSTPGAFVGLFCSTPGIAVARAVPRKVASYLLYTGQAIGSTDALMSGLVSKVVPDDLLEEETEKIVEAIVEKSRPVISLGKAFFLKQIHQDLEEAYEQGEKVMVENLKLADTQEGLSAFIEKRTPTWKHTNQTAT
ncbi:enoyl-CoA hydratase domain-containing protein 3, mitochondrial-like [Limulus polyphemus]|uniref:Enoyl-CoA hydratase domain-containing protein 3, mitochondrial n=1 Tax=Limulus polyphemus TaxID=6850 RepID=A0ABM1B5D7_LIMPO|nr:enoyl-CoA hydratase domain-containing protein 3, mitochondrial-like [Limulus polyphemus]